MIDADSAVAHRPVVLRGTGVILLSSLLFGAMAVCVRSAASEMPALQIAFFRFAGSFLVLLVVTGGRGLRPRPGNLRRLLQRGLLGGSAICFYYLAIQHAGAGLATLVHCTYPVWTTLFAAKFMGERVTQRSMAALGVNLIGVCIVLGPGTAMPAQTTLGVGFALVSSMLAGGAVATARHLRASEDASLITTYFMAVGAGLTAPTLLVGLPPLSAALMMALAGVVVTSVAGQWLLHHGLGLTSATQGSIAAATTVISTAALEALTLGEGLSLHSVIGAIVMMSAVGLALRHR